MSKAKNSRAEGRVELGRYIVADPAICHGKPLNNSGSSTPVQPLSGGEAASLQARLAAKGLWKREAGHRYTPEELKRMSEAAEVTIHRRKRVVMRLA